MLIVNSPESLSRENLMVSFTASRQARTYPTLDTAMDLRRYLKLYLLADNHEMVAYEVFVNRNAKNPQPIQGAWLPPHSHMSNLGSYENVVATIEVAHEMGLNTLFVCAYANNKSLYPSSILLNHTSYQTMDQTLMIPGYRGGSGDPLADLVRLAHARNIRVFLWYESLLVASLSSAPSEDHPILAVYPDWIGRNDEFEFANLDGTDFYLDAFSPQVHDFVIEYILEGVQGYEIDGIMGDRGLAASPINSGYNPGTIRRFQSENGGRVPPSNFRDPGWIEWRTDILSSFAGRLYHSVKSAKPEAQVGFCSPAWTKGDLLQDFSGWLSSDIVDLVAFPCSGREATTYLEALEQSLSVFRSSGTKAELIPVLEVTNQQDDLPLLDPKAWAEILLLNDSLSVSGQSFSNFDAIRYGGFKEALEHFHAQARRVGFSDRHLRPTGDGVSRPTHINNATQSHPNGAY